MILIAYDGSEDAKAAIARVGDLLSGEATTVLSVWERAQDVLMRAGLGMGGFAAIPDFDELDRDYERTARERAEEGLGLARAAGLDARASTRIRDTSIADAILAEADRVEARVVAMGTRGLTGIKSMLLGSVSHAVLQNSDRPVMVIPSPDTARQRSEQRRRRSES